MDPKLTTQLEQKLSSGTLVLDRSFAEFAASVAKRIALETDLSTKRKDVSVSSTTNYYKTNLDTSHHHSQVWVASSNSKK